MNTARLHKILGETTIQLRKGTSVEKRSEGALDVTEIYMMPAVDEARPDLEKIDLEFLVIGVDKVGAEKHRDELVGILNEWPNPERLRNGPSYIEVGGVIGDQGAAFQLFAVGKVLGFWDVITPAKMGFEGAEARNLAGSGFIMINGYHPERATENQP